MKKTSNIFWIIKKIRRRIPAILIMTAAHVGQALLGVAFALGTKNVIDTATSGIGEDFLSACLKQGRIIAGILLCNLLYRHLHDTLAAELDRDWKRELLHGILHGDYPSVSAFHSAELINRLNNDTKTINDGVLSILPNLAAMAARLVSAAAVLVTMEPLFGVAAIVCGLIFVSVTAVLRKPLKALHKKVSAADGKVSGIIQESIEKLLMIQSMDVASEMESRTDEILGERFTLQRRRKNLSLLANMSISFLSQSASFIALVWCAFNLLQGNMSFGELTAVTQLVSQLQMPLVGISGIIPQYVAMSAAAERIMEIEALEREPEPMEAEPEEIYASAAKISAENLVFSYGREKVFENLSFSLDKNSFAVVLGPSGSGKSTLLKLMLGVFRPESGEIFLETEHGKIHLDRRTRRLFAYVPQGNLLLSGTLRENLIITKPDATEDEISAAVHISAMDDYLPSLPKGLETVLGENGAGLSEGQAQRLAIARAVLCGAPILLLDECTSALDAETEIKVLERLRALTERTCIAVTHRPAATEISDAKIMIEKA